MKTVKGVETVMSMFYLINGVALCVLWLNSERFSAISMIAISFFLSLALLNISKNWRLKTK